MSAIYFDTHKYISTLRAAGVPESQAEAFAACQTEALTTITDANLATKNDIQDIRKDIQGIHNDIQDIRLILVKHDGEFTLLKWMLGFLVAGVLSLVLKAFFI